VIRAVPFVDGINVVLTLLRQELPALRAGQPAAHVFEDIPDLQSRYLPMVAVRRTAGASDAPRFHSQFWCHVQVWSAAETGADPKDPFEAAWVLSQQVSRVFFEAWENQTTTPAGHIVRWRESSGFSKFTDPDLPHIGRYDAVVDLLIRNPRPA
jgi:hypothetical protein